MQRMSRREIAAFDRDLRLLARDPWFREGIRILFALTADQMSALFTDTNADFEARADGEAAIGLEPRDYRFALAALEYIYTKARDKGLTPQETAKTLIGVIGAESDEGEQQNETQLLANLVNLFQPRPAFEFQRAQSHIVKVLAAVSLALDLRAVETTPDQPALFVPVILARLEFDEGPPVVFQMTDSLYDELLDEISHYRELLAQTTRQLGDQILAKDKWIG